MKKGLLKRVFCVFLLTAFLLPSPGVKAADNFDLFDEMETIPESVSPSKSTAPVSSASKNDYKIGVGDLLEVDVYDEPDLTKEVRVLTDGDVSIPLLGNVRALGRSVGELERDITLKLKEKYLVNPQVTIFVKEFSNIYVFGEVKKPGSFPLYGRMTAFEAVTLAGGFTEVANTSKVKIIRQQAGKEIVYEINVDKITKGGDTSEDVDLEANDRVIVPRSFF